MKIYSSSTLALHFTKHKTGSRGLQKHNERKPGQKHSNKNILPERTKDNIFLVADERTYSQRINSIIEKNYTGKRAIRKDAVKMVEATVQLGGDLANGEFDDQITALTNAFEVLKERYGEDNIVSAVIHVDETTPHLHFDFVPITEKGGLSAKQVLGGRTQLKQYQSTFLETMQERMPKANFERKQDNQFNGLEQKLFEKMTAEKQNIENELDQLEEELDQREEKLEQRESELSERENQLKSDQDVLKASQKALQNSESLLSNREDQVTQKEQKLALRDSELSQREDRLKSDQDALKTSQKALRDSESRLANREAQTSQKEKELSERERELSESKKKADDEIKHRKNHLQKSYDDAMDKVKKREEKLDQKDDSLAKKSQELSATSDRLLIFQQELDAQKAEQEKIQQAQNEKQADLLIRELEQEEEAERQKRKAEKLEKWEKRLKNFYNRYVKPVKELANHAISRLDNHTLSRSEADQLGDDLSAGLDNLMDQFDQFQQ